MEAESLPNAADISDFRLKFPRDPLRTIELVEFLGSESSD